MQWIRFTIETTTEACDSVCGVLYGLGYDSVEIEDGTPVHDLIQGRDYEELYRNADKALYKVKGSGKNMYELHSGEEQENDK